jgi:phosphorylcholine metabolism protein LicD
MKKYRYNVGGLTGFVNKVMYTLHHKLGMFKKVFDEQKELNKLISTCAQHVDDTTCDGYFCHGYIYNLNAPHKCFFEKKWFDEVVEAKFEDMTCPIPKNYDEILTLVYKDYMTLPSEDQRIFHGIEIIKRNEK